MPNGKINWNPLVMEACRITLERIAAGQSPTTGCLTTLVHAGWLKKLDVGFAIDEHVLRAAIAEIEELAPSAVNADHPSREADPTVNIGPQAEAMATGFAQMFRRILGSNPGMTANNISLWTDWPRVKVEEILRIFQATGLVNRVEHGYVNADRGFPELLAWLRALEAQL